MTKSLYKSFSFLLYRFFIASVSLSYYYSASELLSSVADVDIIRAVYTRGTMHCDLHFRFDSIVATARSSVADNPDCMHQMNSVG